MKNKSKVINILFGGTGGQGVLSAAEICGWAALIDGFHVKKSEVHGMAQRGGSVESHLRFGKKVYSPLIPMGEADYLVGFHKEEARRLEGFMSKKGVNLAPWLERAASKVSDRRFLNIFMLGLLSRHLEISEASWLAAIERVLANKKCLENKDVFLMGRGSRHDLE